VGLIGRYRGETRKLSNLRSKPYQKESWEGKSQGAEGRGFGGKEMRRKRGKGGTNSEGSR